jgi:hypothetical protein
MEASTIKDGASRRAPDCPFGSDIASDAVAATPGHVFRSCSAHACLRMAMVGPFSLEVASPPDWRDARRRGHDERREHDVAERTWRKDRDVLVAVLQDRGCPGSPRRGRTCVMTSAHTASYARPA